MTKICDFAGVTPDGTALQYTFRGTVTNNGAGTVYDVQVVDTPLGVTGTQAPPNPISVAASIASGASANWGPVTFTTNALTFTDQAVAMAASAPGGAQTVTDTTTAPICWRIVQDHSAFSQPTFGTVFLLSEFSRQLQNFFIDFSLAAIRAQGLRELFGQTVPEIDFLDAALLQ